jgi:predicted nucleic acid-binding protein
VDLVKRAWKSSEHDDSSPRLRLYIDTNIFLDHFLRRRGRSSTLLREIANGRFAGITSHFTLSELTGVLKELGVPHADIGRIFGKCKHFRMFR